MVKNFSIMFNKFLQSGFCAGFCVYAACAILGASSASGQDGAAALQPAPADAAPAGIQERIYSIYNDYKNAVVKVYAQKETSALVSGGTKKMKLDVGTGFLINKEGNVMTSAFIVYSSSKLWVEWKGVLFEARMTGVDPLTTMAVIKIEGDFKSKDAPFVKIDSFGEIAPIGTLLISLSYEMGLPPSPRIGLATGHNIEFGGVFLPTVYLRTNLPAFSGSTGGPVFDLNGRFAGIIIASLPEVGGSFLLPARAAARIRDDILLCSEPIYSWFGLRAEDRDGPDGSTTVVVNLVIETGPANKAGFKTGDIIQELNGTKIENNTQLRNITFFVRPGETAKFKILRGSETLKLDVLADRMDPDIVKSAEVSLLPKFADDIKTHPTTAHHKFSEQNAMQPSAAKAQTGVSAVPATDKK